MIGAVAGQLLGRDTRSTAIGTVVTQTADNATEAGRARNRRIEIFLAERAQR